MAKRKDELEELLGTRDRAEQAQKVKSLQNALNMPVLDLVIRFDTVTNQSNITIIGGNPPFQLMYHILDEARKVVQRAEVKASIDQRVKQNGGQPGHPDLPPEDTAEPSPEMNAPEASEV